MGSSPVLRPGERARDARRRAVALPVRLTRRGVLLSARGCPTGAGNQARRRKARRIACRGALSSSPVRARQHALSAMRCKRSRVSSVTAAGSPESNHVLHEPTLLRGSAVNARRPPERASYGALRGLGRAATTRASYTICKTTPAENTPNSARKETRLHRGCRACVASRRYPPSRSQRTALDPWVNRGSILVQSEPLRAFLSYRATSARGAETL